MAGNQPPPGIRQIIDRADWRTTLERDYTDTAGRLQDAYKNILPQLRGSAGAFTQQLTDWQRANPNDTLSTGDIPNMTSYQELLTRVEIELRGFGEQIRAESANLQSRAVGIGLDAALDLTTQTTPGLEAIIGTAWNRPDPLALQTLINYVDSAAFQTNAAQFGANAAQSIADVILAGVAQGKNPRAIASLISTWYSVPYAWAENMARTTQLYSYRGASHAAYAANSDVLSGWMWYAALDTWTCMSCIHQHGKQFPLTESLNDHHRGRCVAVPVVKGSTWPSLIITGENWFNSQSPARQQAQMGGALYRAWKAGAIAWNDMSVKYQDSVFGEMLREVTVSGKLGKKAAQQYYWFNQ